MIVIDVSDRDKARGRRSIPQYIDLTRQTQIRNATFRYKLAIWHVVILIGIATFIALDFRGWALIWVAMFVTERVFASRVEFRDSRTLRRDLA